MPRTTLVTARRTTLVTARRTTLVTARRAALGAAVAVSLLLAGCSNDNAGAPPTSSTATTGNDVSAPGSGAGSGSAAASGTDSGAGSMTGSAAGSMSGSVTAGEPMSTATTSVSPSSRSPKPTPSSPQPSGTGVVGTFSKADINWFDAMCSGLANKPRTEFEKLTGDLDSKRAAAATLLTDQADRLEKSAGEIGSVPPPAVEGGSDLAAGVAKAFPKIAAAARSGAASVKAATDEAGLQKAFEQALDAMNEQTRPLSAFDQMMGAPAMVDRLKGVPSCAPLVG